MDCGTFELLLTEYLEGELQADSGRFAEHALRCRPCRALLDGVKLTLLDCKTQVELETPPELTEALERIPVGESPLKCPGFEELVSDFLDGFLPAQSYHKFEVHSRDCGDCSDLLRDVVYAIGACHSAIIDEQVEVPAKLEQRLHELFKPRAQPFLERLANRLTTAAAYLIPRRAQGAPLSFATASFLTFATFGLLLVKVSAPRPLEAVYLKAFSKAAELYSQSGDIYAQKDEVVAGLQRVGSDIGEIWKTLGGESTAGQKVKTAGVDRKEPGPSAPPEKPASRAPEK